MINGGTTGVQCLAEKFWDLSGHFVLSFNDLSLPLGGLFDIAHDWYTPHLFHRLGRSVDINHQAINSDTHLPMTFEQDDDGYVTDDNLMTAAIHCHLVEIPEGPSIHFELSTAVF
jgi:hypothetical protein